MKIYLATLIFLFSTQLYAKDKRTRNADLFIEKEKPAVKKKCDKELSKICGKEKMRPCLKQKLSSFSKQCQSTVMKRVVAADIQKYSSKAENKYKSCDKEIKKVCGSEGLSSNCIKKKMHQFSKNCKGLASHSGKMEKAGMAVLGSCAQDMERLCPAGKGKLGGREQVRCFQKNLSKMNSKCKKALNNSKVSAKKDYKKVKHLNQ